MCEVIFLIVTGFTKIIELQQLYKGSVQPCMGYGGGEGRSKEKRLRFALICRTKLSQLEISNPQMILSQALA